LKGKNYNTGKQAEKNSWEVADSLGYVRPTGPQRKNIVAAFAKQGIEVKKNGFDLVEKEYLPYLDNAEQLSQIASKITLYEMKTAGRNRKTPVESDWKKLGFTLTHAEKHNASVLKEKYKFIFLNLATNQLSVYKLEDFFNEQKARIYPTWSVFIKGTMM